MHTIVCVGMWFIIELEFGPFHAPIHFCSFVAGAAGYHGRRRGVKKAFLIDLIESERWKFSSCFAKIGGGDRGAARTCYPPVENHGSFRKSSVSSGTILRPKLSVMCNRFVPL